MDYRRDCEANVDLGASPGDEVIAAQREAITRYILSIVRDRDEAEDLVQEALLRAHRRLPTLRDPTKLVPWLYRIATNVCRDRFRQPSYRQQALPLEPDPGGAAQSADAPADPRLDVLMEQAQMSACVRDYLAGLSDSYRAVILLHDVEGLANPEIARMLGVSLATVKIRIHRAREKLRAALTKACAFSTDERGVLVCEPKHGGEDR